MIQDMLPLTIFPLVNRSKQHILYLSVLVFSFLSLILYYGPTDHEEYLNTTLSTLLNASALRHGHFLLWSDMLGFGTPMPIGHDNSLHPLFWLWPSLSLPILMGIYWTLHMLLAGVYFARLLRLFSITGSVFYASLFSYIFSMPFLTLVYQNDWPTLFFNWAMFPVWFYYALMLVEKHHRSKPAFATIRLGLLVGICLANAHFGYLSVLFSSASLVIFLLALRTPKVFLHLTCAGLIAAIIGAANISYVISEIQLYPAHLTRFAENGYSFRQLGEALVAPFSLTWLLHPTLPHSLGEIGSNLLSVNRSARVLTFGTPFMIAALLGIVFAIRQKSWRMVCIATGMFFAVSMTLLSPEDLYGIPSGTWLFRDMAIFFGLLLAAIIVQKLSPLHRNGIAFIQCIYALALAIPSFYYSVSQHHYYRDAQTPTPIIQAMIEQARGHGTRIYFAPGIEQYFSRGRNNILNDPLELSLYGFAPVNGWFKGAAQDAFFPSANLMHSFIKGNQATLRNTALLNLLGIELVVAGDSDMPANPHLTELWSQKLPDESHIHLLQNQTAWQRAWLMQHTAQDLTLHRWKDCDKPGLLCADVRALAAMRLPEAVEFSSDNGRMHVRFPSANNERILAFSMLHRADWHAYTGPQALDVFKLADALLAVHIPAGISEVTLEYRPAPRHALRILGFMCFSACLAFLFMRVLVLRKSTLQSPCR